GKRLFASANTTSLVMGFLLWKCGTAGVGDNGFRSAGKESMRILLQISGLLCRREESGSGGKHIGERSGSRSRVIAIPLPVAVLCWSQGSAREESIRAARCDRSNSPTTRPEQ